MIIVDSCWHNGAVGDLDNVSRVCRRWLIAACFFVSYVDTVPYVFDIDIPDSLKEVLPISMTCSNLLPQYVQQVLPHLPKVVRGAPPFGRSLHCPTDSGGLRWTPEA